MDNSKETSEEKYREKCYENTLHMTFKHKQYSVLTDFYVHYESISQLIKELQMFMKCNYYIDFICKQKKENKKDIINSPFIIESRECYINDSKAE